MSSSTGRTRMSTPRPPWWPLLAIGAFAFAGYVGPWVTHRAAGLVVTGLDLAEYAKFLPEVASGALSIQRELFYLPLLAGSLGLTLIASRQALPMVVRAILVILAVPVALMMLPPAWKPSDLRASEYLWQVVAIGVCLLTVFPGLGLIRYLPDRVVCFAILWLAIFAATGPTWAFLRIHPAIENVYLSPLRLGWGLWVNLSAYLLVATVAFAQILPAPSSRRRL